MSGIHYYDIQTHSHTILTRRLHNVFDVDGEKGRAGCLEDDGAAQFVTHIQTDAGRLHEEWQRGDDVAVSTIPPPARRLLADTQLPAPKLVRRYADGREGEGRGIHLYMEERERERKGEKEGWGQIYMHIGALVAIYIYMYITPAHKQISK